MYLQTPLGLTHARRSAASMFFVAHYCLRLLFVRLLRNPAATIEIRKSAVKSLYRIIFKTGRGIRSSNPRSDRVRQEALRSAFHLAGGRWPPASERYWSAPF